MPLNLDFCWPSLTIIKGLPYSSVAYTAELGSMLAAIMIDDDKGNITESQRRYARASFLLYIFKKKSSPRERVKYSRCMK